MDGTPEKREVKVIHRTNVIAIEDAPSLANALRFIWNDTSVFDKCDVFDTPQDALERIKEGAAEYDAAVVDYKMPGMSGAQWAVEARKLNPNLVVTLLSSHGREDLSPEDVAQFDLIVDKSGFSIGKAKEVAGEIKQAVIDRQTTSNDV